MERRRKIVFGVVLPLLVIAAAVAAMKVMVALKRPPARVAARKTGILVETLTVTLADRRVEVPATGTVQPARKISIVPQVSGKVVRVSPRFVRGGFFAAGEEMFAIEDVDYRLAVEKAESLVAKRKVELASVESKAEVARREWKRLGRGKPPENSLVLYGPQLKEARASLAGAVADRELARLNLGRTRVTAPFDCVITGETVDLGQYVRAGTPVGEAVDSGRAEVIAPVTLADLDWLDLPRDGKEGPEARVWVPGRGGEVWRGRVDRLLADVDSRDRMVRLVVVVDDPFRRKGGGLPLPMGQFVELSLAGRTLRDAAVIPRSALHDGDVVWLYRDGALEFRKVEAARRQRDQVLVASGLAAGDRVVLTMIAGAAPGMKLRLAEAAR